MGKKIFLDAVICHKHQTLKEWQEENPVLEDGELSFVSDGKDDRWIKVGDGKTSWNNLPYNMGAGTEGDNGNVNVDQTYSPESENAQSGKAVAQALANVGGGYTKILSGEVTQENVDNAGENGLTVVSFGNANVSFAPYDEILICIDTPATSEINPATTPLYIAFSQGQNFSLADGDVFLRAQGTSAWAGLIENTKNKIRVKGNFKEDTFLYGEVFKNGHATSLGYAGTSNGWTSIATSFVKNKKKYVHITTANQSYKFQTGTTVTVYGR